MTNKEFAILLRKSIDEIAIFILLSIIIESVYTLQENHYIIYVADYTNSYLRL